MTRKKQKATFEQWMARVDAIANREGYAPKLGRTVFDLAHWKDLYDRGLTPQEAWDKT